MVHRFASAAGSVVASPVEDALFVLESLGSLGKVRIPTD